MWDDLGKNQDQIIEHDLCRAIAGDQSVRLKVPEGLPKARDLDAVAHPAMTYHILDSDSSQHEAIEAVKRGASLVLDGPPARASRKPSPTSSPSSWRWGKRSSS